MKCRVPTINGIQLGAMRSTVPGIEGTCGCLYYWMDEVRYWMNRANLPTKPFADAVYATLDEQCNKLGIDGHLNITSFAAANTLRNRMIAFTSIRAGLIASGINVLQASVGTNEKASFFEIEIPDMREN